MIAPSDLEPGAHLVVSRRVYSHHGVYAGDGWVIHKDCGPVQLISLTAFANGRKVRVEPSQPGDFPLPTVLARAQSRLVGGTGGDPAYDLFADNCEHFVAWCRSGRSESQQVAAGIVGMGVGLMARQVLMLHPAVAAFGAVAAFVVLSDAKRSRKVAKEVKRVGRQIRGLRRFIPIARDAKVGHPAS